MKFTFSSKFRQPLYQQLLCDLGNEIDTYRILSGINVKELMTALHISHPIVKRY